MKEEKYCKQSVRGQGQWGSFHPHQCKRKVWKDGYCKTHHPDTMEERQRKSRLLYEEKRKHEPWYLLKEAQEEIKQLKEELKRCKEEVLVLRGVIKNNS